MNPSYFRILLPEDEAVERLCNWIGKKPKEIIRTGPMNAVSSATENGNWKGRAVYVTHKAGWTVFEDLSGSFFGTTPENWMPFAGNESLVVAGYNDALLVAELIVVENKTIVKDFFEYADEPESFRNAGSLPGKNPIESWIDVASFVDDDDIVFSNDGTVLIF